MVGIKVDHAFYVEEYKGTSIPEEAFPGYSRAAEAFVNKLTFGRIRKYELRLLDQMAVQYAICAVSEVSYREDRHRGVKSESNDGYSISYADSSDSTVRARMADAADVYLCDTTLRNRCLAYDY